MIDLVKTVLPGVNAVVNAGIADPNRLALMGLSNGGYSTLALIVQTKRFRCAVEMDGMGDLIADYGHMDKKRDCSRDFNFGAHSRCHGRSSVAISREVCRKFANLLSR